jgi:hypothetical protein
MSAQAVSAQSAYHPPPPGTLLTWSYNFDGDSFTRLSEIVAIGEDFVIYQTDIRYTARNSSQFVVEFSGVHAQTCNQPLPADEDRLALSSLWPLVPGASVSVKGGASPSQYLVQERASVTFPAFAQFESEAMRIQGQVGEAEVQLIVSDEHSIPISMVWSEGNVGRVIEMIEPNGQPGEAVDLSSLGYCAGLLQ